MPETGVGGAKFGLGRGKFEVVFGEASEEARMLSTRETISGSNTMTSSR